MNLVKAFLLKAHLGAAVRASVGVCALSRRAGGAARAIVFFRAAFAIVPVLLIDAWRRELADVVRTKRPLGHLGRGTISMCGMFLNFAALARLPLVDATAISFAAPLITVAFAALFLGERVRIYRWSAVAVGFVGIIVMLWPYLNLAQYAAGGSATAAATIGASCGLLAAFTNAGSVIQTRRLTDTETTSSIVFYFSLYCAIAGLATLPFGWIWPSADAACRADRVRRDRRARPYRADVELPLCAGVAGRAARLHHDDLGVRARLFPVRRSCRRSMCSSAAPSSRRPAFS